MILSEAQTEIRNGMQYLAQSTAGDALILRKLKETQDDLEKGKSLPKFLLTEDATFTGAANVSTANLPTGFIRFSEDNVPYWTGPTGATRELKVGEYGYLRQVWNGSTLTDPQAIAVRKSTIKLFPTPSAAWTVTYSYYAKGVVLVNPNDENVWLTNEPWLMVYGAGMRFAADRQDQVNATKFSTLYRAQYASYLAKIVDEEIAIQNVIMGGNR